VTSLGDRLDAAARGAFPPADGQVEIIAGAPSRFVCIVVYSFTAHMIVAGDVDAAGVRERARPHDFASWGQVAPWLAREHGGHAYAGDVALAGVARGGEPPLALERADDHEHTRVDVARQFRDDVRVFVTPARDGVLVLGRGVAGRHELAFEVEARSRGAGLGRDLVRAAQALVPAGEVVWAQVHPGNTASLRAVLAGGLAPVGFEQLIRRA